MLLGRAARVTPDATTVFRALIDAVLDSGIVPDLAALSQVTAMPPERIGEALDELASADWIARDDDGRISAVYPFAISTTGVDVTVGDQRRPVMCAIDALGVAPLLDRRVAIRAACVQCDTTIQIGMQPGGIASRRPRSVVVIRRRASGPAHAMRCAATRFACSPAHADAWLARHGGSDDVIQSLEVAAIEAREIFGHAYLG